MPMWMSRSWCANSACRGPALPARWKMGRAVTLVADTATAAAENPNTILMTAIESQVALSDADEVLLSADRRRDSAWPNR